MQYGLLAKTGVRVVDKLCKKYGKTPAQIAINWLVSQDSVITLSKMSSPEHMKENLGALSWKMDKADIEMLRREFPAQQDVSDSVPLA
jgi:diketogulonate reductase-like aldo/keto reductase